MCFKIDPVTTTEFNGIADTTVRVAYNTTTGAIFYDADGIGGRDAALFATMNTPTPTILGAADFVVVG